MKSVKIVLAAVLVLVAGSAFAGGLSTGIRGGKPQSTESSGIKPKANSCGIVAPSDSCH